MNIGMLWFDNDPRTSLEEKIKKAAEYYRRKYGRTPNLCMVNPAIIGKPDAEKADKSSINVRPMHSIMPGHFWIGIDEPQTGAAD